MKNKDKKTPKKITKNLKTKKTSFSIGYLLLFLVVLYVIQMFLTPKAGEITYSQFREYLSEGKIVDCTVGEKVIKGHYESAISEQNKPVAFITVPVQDIELVNELEDKNVKFKGEVENNF
ncbi:MAG: cell division protein FtsH, partial [Candidatus Scalindua sp.]|nr:cell division protein FtsH [Candidatus Scalindua sp.]